MADELEKFVLQYSVDMKDAVQRLEKLQGKIEGVAKTANKSNNGFKEFGKGALEEFEKVVPGVDKVSAAVRLLSAEFAVATVAVGALAIGIKATMAMRDQYNQQRREGMQVGVSSMRMEEYQRKFVRNSSGNVSRETTASEVGHFGSMLGAAYADPTRMGTEARQLRMLGINPGERGGPSTPVNAALSQLGATFSKMKPEQVQGIAKSIGMNQDFALTLAKLGDSVGKVTEMTTEDIKKREDAQNSLREFNTSMAKLTENFKEAENILGEKLIGSFGKFLKFLADMSDALPKATGKTTDAATGAAKQTWGFYTHLLPNLLRPGLGLGGLKGAFNAVSGVDTGNWIAGMFGAKGKKGPVNADGIDVGKGDEWKTSEKNAKAADTLLDAADAENKNGRNMADSMNLAVNMFSGAVASFANAIDEHQAWAAWAGEVGKAAGLSGNPNTTGPGATFDAGKSTLYDPIFAAAAAKTGMSAELLKRIANVESGFNPNAISPVGAEGLMQIMPSNKKGLGITDSLDPTQNIYGGAQLLADYMKRAGGNVREALMMYHGGLDRSGWGAKTMAYPGKVLGDATLPGPGATGIHGESRAKLQLRSVQQNIANRLQIPLAQVQQGQVNRGDVSFASSQLDGGIQNNISNLQRELQNAMITPSNRAKILNDIRDQQSGLAMLRQYAPDVEGKAQDGQRSITIGERAIIINVTGTNPTETAQTVAAHLQDHITDIANGTSSARKW